MFLGLSKAYDFTLNIGRARNFLHGNYPKWCKIQVITSKQLRPFRIVDDPDSHDAAAIYCNLQT